MNAALWIFMAAAGGADVDVIVPVAVEAEVVISWDEQQTVKDAQRAARRLAIERGAAAAFASNPIMKNNSMMADELVTSIKGLITDEEWGPLTDGGVKATKKIALTAKVNQSAVERSVCVVVKAIHDPKVAFAYVERSGPAAKWSTTGALRAGFEAAFTDLCFSVVDPGAPITAISATGDLPQATLQAMLKSTDAQYLALSTVVVAPDQRAVSASVKLVNTATQQIEAVATRAAALPDEPSTTTTLADVLKTKIMPLIMYDIVPKIVQRWDGGEGPGFSPTQVVVTGTYSVAQAKAFQAALQKLLPDLQLTARGSKAGLTYDARVDGGSERLAAAIDGKDAGKLVIEIIEVTRGKVVVRLNPPPRAR